MTNSSLLFLFNFSFISINVDIDLQLDRLNFFNKSSTYFPWEIKISPFFCFTWMKKEISHNSQITYLILFHNNFFKINQYFDTIAGINQIIKIQVKHEEVVTFFVHKEYWLTWASCYSMLSVLILGHIKLSSTYTPCLLGFNHIALRLLHIYFLLQFTN